MIIMNLLQIVQTMCDELGLNRPAVVVNSSDLQIRQLYALTNRTLRELQQNYNWTTLQTEFDLFVAQPTQTVGDCTQGNTQINNIPTTSFITDPQLWVVSGQFIPVAARVVSVNGPTQVTISEAPTGTQTQVPLVFAQDTYAEPPDFDRFINQTWWDRTNRWALLGPDSPQIDQWHRSGIVTIGPRRHFRQIGSNNILTGTTNNYRIWPAPGATDTPLNLAYEYISTYSVFNTSGMGQSSFLSDTDIPIIDPNAIILDTKWRFWQIKGFDYLPMQMEAKDYIDRLYASDGGGKTVSLTTRKDFFIATGYVQDGNWPGPSSSGV